MFSKIWLTDVTRLNFFKVARAAFFSKVLGVKRRARISARQLHYLVLQISMTSRDYLFIIFH